MTRPAISGAVIYVKHLDEMTQFYSHVLQAPAAPPMDWPSLKVRAFGSRCIRCQRSLPIMFTSRHHPRGAKTRR